MNTLNIEAELAKKYSYKKLPDDLSSEYRKLYQKNIPEFLKINGDTIPLFTKNGTEICRRYERIVVGDYGAFVEFTEDQANKFHFDIQPGEEYRITDPRYSKNVKYIWLTISDGSNIKIYYQQKTVIYADYRPGFFYISPHECCIYHI